MPGTSRNANLVSLLDVLRSHTHRLVECDSHGHMWGKAGSCFLWHRGDKIHLITVAHNFKNVKGNIRLDSGQAKNGIALFFEVPEPGWFRVTSSLREEGLGNSINEMIENAREVDFAWATYKAQDVITKIKAARKEKGVGGDLCVIRHDLETTVTKDTKYNFAANVPTDLHYSTGTFDWKQVVEFDMEYEGIQAGGKYDGMYRFRLPNGHKGDDHYVGSSGAPIADDVGNPVALVAAGDEPTKIIFGCPLQPFVRYLEL